MTPNNWVSLGWIFMVATFLLAVVSATMVFTSIDTEPVYALSQNGHSFPPSQDVHTVRFLGGVAAAVVAGASFFCGPAPFVWSGSRRQHDLLEEILDDTVRKMPDKRA